MSTLSSFSTATTPVIAGSEGSDVDASVAPTMPPSSIGPAPVSSGGCVVGPPSVGVDPLGYYLPPFAYGDMQVLQ